MRSDDIRGAGTPRLAEGDLYHEVMGHSPSDRWSLIYDGQCGFCCAGSAQLARWFRPGTVELIDYHQPGALDRFPGITGEACGAAMHLVSPTGEVYKGAAAAAHAVASRGGIWRAALVCEWPGVRWVCARVYAFIAANRYRIAGRVSACENGACRVPGHRGR